MERGYIVKNKPIRHNGVRYTPGEFIEEDLIDEASAKRLTSLNAIVKSFVEKDDSGESEIITGQNEGDLNPPGESLEETLYLNFDLDELKDGAKDQGLTFPGNIAKKKLIALIIENEKTEYFLDQLED